MLSISNLTYRIANRPIFDNAGLTIAEGWKTGLVGPNGAGKSTLFKIITHELGSDAGNIELHSRYSIGYIKQEISNPTANILDFVLAADVERTDLLHRSETETDPYKIAEIHTRLNDINAYTAPARASSILAGLGFKDQQLQEPLSTLSGGWQMRVALAAALFQQPDLLLLDEPTNHLDLEAIIWLQNYLATYPHTLLVISHDRELLNTCTDHIAHLENKQLTLYTGNYDTFERERNEKRALQQKMHKKQQEHVAHMQEFIDRFRAKASKAKQAQSRLKALERMELVSAVIADRTTTFAFPQPEELPPPLIHISDVDLGYGDAPPILTNINERIDMDDRIALLGANGNGKSTLIKFIAGRLKGRRGGMHHATKLRIGYFSQHQTEELDVTQTPYEAMARLMRGNPEAGIRGKLGQFGFNKTLQETKIGALSGGEKARLLFALLSYNAPHLLLLDEPTNHLDIDAREALIQALTDYNGAVLIVSHDPALVERVADRLWLVKDGKVQNYEGDLDSYRQLVLENRRQERKANKPNKGPTAKEKREQAAAKRKQFAPLFKNVEKAEKEVNRLTKTKKDLENQLADPALYDNPEELKTLQFTYGQLLKELDSAETEWLAAQETYDMAGTE